MTSESGGTPTPSKTELIAFYRSVMQKCDQIDQRWAQTHWTKTDARAEITSEMETLMCRLAQCASAVPDEQRAEVLAEVFGERIDHAAT